MRPSFSGHFNHCENESAARIRYHKITCNRGTALNKIIKKKIAVVNLSQKDAPAIKVFGVNMLVWLKAQELRTTCKERIKVVNPLIQRLIFPERFSRKLALPPTMFSIFDERCAFDKVAPLSRLLGRRGKLDTSALKENDHKNSAWR